jgi:hypothetical protein
MLALSSPRRTIRRLSSVPSLSFISEAFEEDCETSEK